MKSYKLFTESEQINKGDLIRLKGTDFGDNDKVYKVLKKFYSNGSADADDGKENIFNLVNPLDTEDEKFLHKDYIRKATKEEIAQLKLELDANKYNL